MAHGVGASPVRCSTSTVTPSTRTRRRRWPRDARDGCGWREFGSATDASEKETSGRASCACVSLDPSFPRSEAIVPLEGRVGAGATAPIALVRTPPVRRSRCLPDAGVSTDLRPASSMPAKCTASGPAAAARASKRAHLRPNVRTETGAAGYPIGRRFGGTSFYSRITFFIVV